MVLNSRSALYSSTTPLQIAKYCTLRWLNASLVYDAATCFHNVKKYLIKAVEASGFSTTDSSGAHMITGLYMVTSTCE